MRTTKERNESIHRNRFIVGKRYYAEINPDSIYEFVGYEEIDSSLIFKHISGSNIYFRGFDGYYHFSFAVSFKEVPE